eukprot:668689-Rhodomonas_salina.2
MCIRDRPCTVRANTAINGSIVAILGSIHQGDCSAATLSGSNITIMGSDIAINGSSASMNESAVAITGAVPA